MVRGRRLPDARRAGALALTLSLVFLLALPATAAAYRKVGLSSPSFGFNVAAGQTYTGNLIVFNDGTEPMKVMVYAANQVTGKDGKVAYEVPKFDSPDFRGPATWFRILMPEKSKSLGNTPYVETEPGDRVQVKFEFQVPADAPPGDHNVVLFFEMFDFSETGGMLSQVSGRVGSRIKIRVQGRYLEKVEVRPFNVRSLVIGDTMPYRFVARNGGNLDKIVSAKLELLDTAEASLVESMVVTEEGLYAHTLIERGGKLDVSRAGIGKRTARLTLSYLSDPDSKGATVPREIVEDRTVWVIPLWLAVIIVLIVGWLALWLTWKQAVRAAQRRAERAGTVPRPGAVADPDAGADPGWKPTARKRSSRWLFKKPPPGFPRGRVK